MNYMFFKELLFYFFADLAFIHKLIKDAVHLKAGKVDHFLSWGSCYMLLFTPFSVIKLFFVPKWSMLLLKVHDFVQQQLDIWLLSHMQ